MLTSGISSIYPAGLLVGEVTALTVDPYSQGIVATIQPAVDLTELRKVMILTGFDSYTR